MGFVFSPLPKAGSKRVLLTLGNQQEKSDRAGLAVTASEENRKTASSHPLRGFQTYLWKYTKKRKFISILGIMKFRGQQPQLEPLPSKETQRLD